MSELDARVTGRYPPNRDRDTGRALGKPVVCTLRRIIDAGLAKMRGTEGSKTSEMRIIAPIVALGAGLLGACSGDSSDTGNAGSGGSPPSSAGTGGAGIAGQSAAGGSTATGGANGAPTGGTSTGGTPGTSAGATSGGSSAGGSSAGGSPATGGATTTAGVTGTGGTSAGAPGSGGGGAGGAGGVGGAPPGSACPPTPKDDPNPFPKGWTRGEVKVFNENGAWTWYNDERVVVDTEAGKMVISSAASSKSNEGAIPNIDAVIHDLATGQNQKTVLGSLSYSDDHNNGGIVITGPGKYFVGWAHHNVDCNSYYRNYENGAWSAAVTFQWGQGCPWGTRPDNITYNNPWKMSSEGRYYNFVRSIETSPGILVSEDDGKTWTYRGRLTSTAQQGYNAGYYKYWGNGVDRIDFFATEAHPRDFDTSVYHGYIQGGKSYDSMGVQQDDNVLDGNAPAITKFTKVFAAKSQLNGVELNALWNFDVARYEDGSIAVLWQGRVGPRGKDNMNPNHRIAYSRFDGTQWKSTYLVRGGRTLYRDMNDWWEEDYLGGAALDPDDPRVIYVSTPIDPRDDMTNLGNHEIWRGVTCDNGATFQWSPMTMNSPNENLRPVVPKWNAQNSALLWFRGSYQTAQRYDAQVVGILSKRE